MKIAFLKRALPALGVLALAVPAAAQFGGPPPPPNTGVPIYATLAGGPVAGHFTAVVDPPKGTFCYLGNIHGVPSAPAGTISADGRTVLNLAPVDGNTLGGCVNIEASLAEALLANPAGYTVAIGPVSGRLTPTTVERPAG